LGIKNKKSVLASPEYGYDKKICPACRTKTGGNEKTGKPGVRK
jgi:hypothetical protein